MALTEDPFVKRVTTVRAGDVVIFQLPPRATEQDADDFSAHLEKKMGAVAFVVIDADVNLTVLKAERTPVSQAPMIA